MKKALFLILIFTVCSAKAQTMDKISHTAVGGCIGGFTYCLSKGIGLNDKVAIGSALTFSFASAAIKEVRDRRLYNSPLNESIKDISYTMLGSALACVTLKITF